MRNKRKPFFYKEEKRRGGAIGAILTFFLVAFFWVSLVPTARQIIFPAIYPYYAYLQGSILRPRQPQPRQFLNQTIYEVPERPSTEVIFADSLEALQSVLADENGDASDEATGNSAPVVTATPTVGINWVFVDQKDDEPVIEAELAVNENQSRILTLPTFERADLLNDGPTALSTVLRFLGHTTNQYAIQAKLRPGYLTEPVGILALAEYVAESHPELSTLYRLNGRADQLSAILDAGIPIIVPISEAAGFSEFPEDDRLTRRFCVIFGTDDAAGTVAIRDHVRADRTEFPSENFMRDWYAFGREYLVVYRNDQADALTAALGEDRDERRNLENAIDKFQTDAVNVPYNVFAWLNLARANAAAERYRDALANFRSASNLALPARIDAFYPFLYEVLFENGCADELIAWADYGLKLNRQSLQALLWKGWGNVLRDEDQAAFEIFERAARLAPDHEDVRYALKYLADYR